MVFGIGKSREEKRFEEEQLRKNEEEERQITEALRKIVVFPGDKKEFEDFIGYKTAWVDMGGQIKGLLVYAGVDYNDHEGYEKYNPFVMYDIAFQRKILESGVVGLVDSNFTNTRNMSTGDDIYFGAPVKRK